MNQCSLASIGSTIDDLIYIKEHYGLFVCWLLHIRCSTLCVSTSLIQQYSSSNIFKSALDALYSFLKRFNEFSRCIGTCLRTGVAICELIHHHYCLYQQFNILLLFAEVWTLKLFLNNFIKLFLNELSWFNQQPSHKVSKRAMPHTKTLRIKLFV